MDLAATPKMIAQRSEGGKEQSKTREEKLQWSLVHFLLLPFLSL